MYFAIRVGDAMVGRENTGWTVYGVDIPAHARTAHNGLLQKKIGNLLHRLSCSHEDPVGQGTELN